MRARSLLLLTLLAVAVICIGCGQSGEVAPPGTSASAVSGASAPASGRESPQPVGSECPDPEVAADHVVGLLAVTHDDQASASPADLADRVDAVVSGRVTGIGTSSDGYWLDVDDVALVAGTIEGVWISCGADAPAFTGKLDAPRPGWPENPTMRQLVDAVEAA